MLHVLHSHFDYLAFAAGSLLLLSAVHWWLGRTRVNRPGFQSWLILALILILGWFSTDEAGRSEQEQLRTMVEGFPPTYAQEMQRMGHAKLTLETQPDDPLYLEMIAAEIRWLAVNRSINDIYTFRKLPDGTVVLMVDSETDYDHDGKYEGEREQRTKLGEVYPDVTPTLSRALDGHIEFDGEPYTDRWGTWVSAYAPLYDPQGKMEGILGVDYTAASWVQAIEQARLTMIGYLSVLVVLTAAASGVTAFAVASRELAAEVREKELARISQKKIETLINSLDAIVWEADAGTFRFCYVSSQSARILGYTPEEWLASETFWADHLHPEDGWAVGYCMEMVARLETYQFDYRMLAADGRTVWIRESGGILAEDGRPVLVRGVFLDITAQKLAAAELEATHAKLMEASRQAGMAEVATGVLHNVGNVLNSVNVSSTIINDRVCGSQVASLTRVAALLREKGEGLPAFLADDPRGKVLPALITSLADALVAEQSTLKNELEALTRNIAHIKTIVAMQQDYAKVSGVMEPLEVAALVSDALQINATSLWRHEVTVVRDFQDVPPVLADKHKALQILVNLIRNAKQSLDDSASADRRITITIRCENAVNVKITVSDTGMGIAQENLERVFSLGFTTKPDGHGFGLHSGANAAHEMGGSLLGSSDGPGTGATFTLTLPVAGSDAASAGTANASSRS